MANEYTKRDFLKAVAAGAVTEKEQDYAKAALEKLEAVNEKRRNTPTKAAKANAELVPGLVAVLTDVPKTAPAIAAELGTMTHQKATAVAKLAVEQGLAIVTDVKVAGKGTQKGYAKAPVEGEADAE